MKLHGRYVTVEGKRRGRSILIRKVTIDVDGVTGGGVMHKLGSDVLKLDVQLVIDSDERLHEQMVWLPR